MAASSFSPIPRVAPAPISSGLSFRDLPTATLAQIIKTCQHYESKCAGGYSSPANRYLCDLSREIQDLVRVLKTREDSQSARIRELEGVLKDWFDTFGNPDAALRDAGITREYSTNTPSAVAKKLKELHADSRKLLSGANVGRAHAEKELADMRLALRDASRVSREQAAAEITRVRAEADAAIAAERNARAIAESNLATARENFEMDAERHLQESLHAERARHQQEIQALRSRLDETQRLHQTQISDLRKQLQTARDTLERERATAADAVAASTRSLGDAHERIRSLEGEVKSLVETSAKQMRDCNIQWEDKLTQTIHTHEMATSTARVRAMQSEITFLNARVAELQRMVQIMQTALFHGAAKLNSVGSVDTSKIVKVEAVNPLSPFDTNVSAPIGALKSKTATVRHVGAATAGAVSRAVAEKTNSTPTPTETRYTVIRAGMNP